MPSPPGIPSPTTRWRQVTGTGNRKSGIGHQESALGRAVWVGREGLGERESGVGGGGQRIIVYIMVIGNLKVLPTV